MSIKKPNKLKKGDTIVALSLSRGGPGTYPKRYELGKKQLQDEFGVNVIEGKYTMKSAEWLYNNPEARAEDLHLAFSNPSIQGIISSIGGEESIRILPYIDFSVVGNNPKVFMGYSDTTVSNFICYKAGIVSFYGPSIMAGFGEVGGMFPYMVESVKKTIFSSEKIGIITPNDKKRTGEHCNWHIEPMPTRKLENVTGRRWLQGTGIHNGALLGGCIEVFQFMSGTSIRPTAEEWKGKILFLETSEEKMPVELFERIIRNLGSQGILHNIQGILVGRSQLDYDSGIQINYDNALLKVVSEELGLNKLPIVTNMDFGHTDPMFVLPLGINATIDCDKQVFSINESGCV